MQKPCEIRVDKQITETSDSSSRGMLGVFDGKSAKNTAKYKGKGHAGDVRQINSNEKDLLWNKSLILKLFSLSFIPDIILPFFPYKA